MNVKRAQFWSVFENHSSQALRLGLLAVSFVALIASLTFVSSASAAIGVSEYSLDPSSAASGGNPDLAVSIKRSGSESDDIRETRLDLPAGLDYTIASAVTKCSTTAFNADNCPSPSIVGAAAVGGSVSFIGIPFPSGVGNGTIYALSGSQLGVIVRPNLLSRIHVRQNISGSAATGLSLETTNWPRTTRLFGLFTVNTTIKELRFDYHARSGPTNSGELIITNPPVCGPANSSVTLTAYNGQTASDSDSFDVTDCDPGDVTPPEIIVTAPLDGLTTTDASTVLTYTATDDSGDPPSCVPPSGSSVALALGLNTISVTCEDAAGNQATSSVEVTREPEPLEPPDTTITSHAQPAAGNPSTGPASGPLEVAFVGTEEPSSFECRVDAGAWGGCSSTWIVPIAGLSSPAEHTYEVRAVNAAGPDPTPALGYFWHDDREFSIVPSATAGSNGLEPTSTEANDAGAHPDLQLDFSVHGAEDAEQMDVVSADGFTLSPAAVDPADRCDAAAFGLTGTCPASSRIGTTTALLETAIDGQVTANGTAYLIDAGGLTIEDVAGIAVVFDSIDGGTSGDLGSIAVAGTIRANDQARNTRISLSGIPVSTSSGVRFHMINGSISLDGDQRPVSAGAPSPTNPPLVTNQHTCAPITGRTNYNKFVATGVGHASSTSTPQVDDYAVDNCNAVLFGPTVGFSLSNPVANQTTEVGIDVSLPFDQSPIRVAQFTFPGFLFPNLAAYGALGEDQCSPSTVVTSSGLHQYFEPDNPAHPCPSQARVGTVEINSPLYDSTIRGDVWMIYKPLVPTLGISVDPTTPGNPSGLKFGFVMNNNFVSLNTPTGCDDIVEFCDQAIRFTTSHLPDISLGSIAWDLGTVSGRISSTGSPMPQHLFRTAPPEDPACRTFEHHFAALFASWGGQVNDPGVQPSAPTGCDTTGPSINITSPTNNSTTSAADALLTYVASDDSGDVPTCTPPSGTIVPLSMGLNTITVTCEDSSGNVSSAAVAVTRVEEVPPDTTPPSINITEPQDGSTTEATDTTVQYAATDDSGAAPTCIPANGSTVPLAMGPNVITVTCEDAAGNVASDSVSVTRVPPPDTTPPEISISSPVDNTVTLVDEVTLLYTAIDDSGSPPDCAPPNGSVISLVEGENTITVTCVDGAGNVAVASVTITLVPEPGEPTEITSYANPSAGTPTAGPASPPLEVSFVGGSGTISFECRVDSGAWSACTSPWTVSTAGLFSPAVHTYEVRAITGSGPDPDPPLGHFWYDNRDFTASPTAAAEPNSLEPTAIDANDAGAHPNVSMTFSIAGHDDTRSLDFVLPDGLMVALASVDEVDRCDLASFETTGTCPATSKIGELSADVIGSADGQVSAAGDLYLIDPVISPPSMTTDDFAGVALVLDELSGPVTGDMGDFVALGSLRLKDQGRNVRIVVPEIPRETSAGIPLHLLATTLTLNGDTRPDGGAVPDASNPPLVTNPHNCAAVAGRANYNKLLATATGHTNSLSPTIMATYAVANCAAVPFAPSINWSLSSSAAGQETVLSAQTTLPFDHSPLRIVQPTLPGFVGVDISAVGDPTHDQCPVSTIGIGTGFQFFESDNSAYPCPVQARVGQATIDSPLFDTPLQADVWLISKSAIPNIGISVNPETPGNPQGVKFGFHATTQSVSVFQPPECENFFILCDVAQRWTFASIPDLPVSSWTLDIGTVPGRTAHDGNPLNEEVFRIASEFDSSCRNSGAPASTLAAGWRGAPHVSLSQTLFPTGCGNP